ncbi:type II toxin-antitoxin system prevent-host-death family antitoxin [Nocardiopsis sp. NPDC006198]|uniref:type II toxin-antitoxin system Phd/YefM family antitoxin n=1 Tax=Nocardiopsis sp. NPDC006198 TaxID=3154472 RepID=UPI0033A12251
MDTEVKDHQITIRELQRRAADVFDRARRGESFTVTRHGEVVGRVLPPDPAEEALTRAVDRGVIDLRDLESLPRAAEAADLPREESPPGTRLATDALAELREEDGER